MWDLERRLRYGDVSVTDVDAVSAELSRRVAALVDGRRPLPDAHVNLARVLVENGHLQRRSAGTPGVHDERRAFVDHHTILFNAPTLHCHLK